MIHKKIAMLGMWGVGKTCLVQRYVNSIYAEKYHTTLGVKVDKKRVSWNGQDMMLMLWDIAGAEEYFSVPLHYVQGAAGYLLVIDGTRSASLDCALELVHRIEANLGPLPFVTVINKSDLAWEITETDISRHLAGFGYPILKGSAKTGENVDAAFLALAQLLYSSSK